MRFDKIRETIDIGKLSPQAFQEHVQRKISKIENDIKKILDTIKKIESDFNKGKRVINMVYRNNRTRAPLRSSEQPQPPLPTPSTEGKISEAENK